MIQDFNDKKLRALYSTLIDSDYKVYRVRDYLSKNTINERCAVLRHDVDYKPELALRLAKIEKNMGLHSTYYFRCVEGVFDINTIKKIEEWGHEIGYHYETMDKCDGNANDAYKLFLNEVAIFQKYFHSTTVCPHGSPLDRHYSSYTFLGLVKLGFGYIAGKKVFTNWKNQDVWKNHNFTDIEILGDAYLSFDFTKIHYFSDSSGTWQNEGVKFKDIGGTEGLTITTTDELIELIKTKEHNIYLLIHPNHWLQRKIDGMKWKTMLAIRRYMKRFLFKAGGNWFF